MPPQTTAPTPAPQPVATPPAPAPVAPEPPTQPPVGSSPVPSSSGSSKKLLLIGAIVAVVILLMAAAVVALYFMFFSPAAVTKRVSTEFMNAAAAGDTQKLYEITNSTTDAEKQFIDAAAAATKGTYSLKDGTVQDGKGYYLYDLSNEAGKMGRTTVEKKDGKYVVTGYVFGSDNLALIPGTSEALPTTEPATPTPTPTGTKGCVAATGFKTIGGTGGELNGRMSYFDNIFFDTRSATKYQFPDVTATKYTSYGTFATENANNEYKIEITGQADNNTASADIVKLANDRAATVKAGLLKAGVPEANIEVKSAELLTTTDSSSAERTVTITTTSCIK